MSMRPLPGGELQRLSDPAAVDHILDGLRKAGFE